MNKNWPPLLRYLDEELGYKISYSDTPLGYDLFLLDLSSWKLRFPDQTPLIWVKKSDLEENSYQQLIESLEDVIRESRLGRQTVLVLLEGQSEALINFASRQFYRYVFIGSEEAQAVCNSRRPSGKLLDLIIAQIPLSYLTPYETSAPVTGSRFFGREYERDRILANPDSNFLVLGIRRIGKTSLLHEIERILTGKQDIGRIIYLDCSDLLLTTDFVREVVRKLNPKELPRINLQKYIFYFPDFLERMKRMYGGKIILLLDEIDNLIVQQRGDWELFRMLRAAANSGNCKFVIAGYKEAMKEQTLLDSPLYRFAQDIRLNEFTRKQAYNLIVRPMENLRVRFKNRDEVVGRIYAETAGHPNLIQYYCMILMRKLDQTGDREITPQSLIDIYADEGFKNHLLASFVQNTENREKAIIYTLFTETNENRLKNFSQPYIDAMLRRHGIELKQQDIDEACEVLILAGILHRKGKDYSFTSPVFQKVLKQSYGLDYRLNKAKEEGI